MKTTTDEIRQDLEAVRRWAALAPAPIVLMEVCGTHTMSAFRCGLPSLLPESVRLLSGPGCPVCVTAQGDIDQLLDLARLPDVVLCTYGDMLRVPGARGSLEAARGAGADVRVIYSTLDCLRIAEQNPQRQVVLAGVGFETTAPATAAAVRAAAHRGIQNFSVLSTHKRVLPAMLALLEGEQVRLDGFLCPGHVSIVLGWECFRPIVERFGLPCVIGGFEEKLLARAIAELARQVVAGRAELVNHYPEAVTRHGNPTAQQLLAEVFQPVDARWRGLGELPASGLELAPTYRDYNARIRFAIGPALDFDPPGCRCGDVIAGRITPAQCRLFGDRCTPVRPVGPCMVSSEGTCQAWFKYRRIRELAR